MHYAINDLLASLSRWRLWTLLGWLEIRQRYARSRLGPFWLTISTSVMIISIGLVYGTLFGQDMHEYLPFLAISITFWTMLSQTINEGAIAYISSANYIRQISTPRLVFVLQVAWRNLAILAHNSILIVILLAYFGIKDFRTIPFVIPGLILFLVNVTWVAALAALVSARFRDLPQIISALMQVAFYVTPIVYKPSILTKNRWIIDYNPLAYIMDLVRAPLVGEYPTWITWVICLTMAIVGWLIALVATGRYAKRISYWL
jgi:lipopolysaccharide transport system permease protein